MHFAKASLFINMATILATFDIRPVRDKKGKEIPPKVEMVSNTMVTYVIESF